MIRRIVIIATLGILAGVGATDAARRQSPAKLQSSAATTTASGRLVSARLSGDDLWWHINVKGSSCVIAYAKHEHEVFITRGENGPRTAVSRLVLHSVVGNDRLPDKTCSNADTCGRTYEETGKGCRHSCAYATVDWPGGGQGNTNESCIW